MMRWWCESCAFPCLTQPCLVLRTLRRSCCAQLLCGSKSTREFVQDQRLSLIGCHIMPHTLYAHICLILGRLVVVVVVVVVVPAHSAWYSGTGMGLSVADPATLVSLNSLSPSNYDSAKRLGERECRVAGAGYPVSLNLDELRIS